MTRFIITVYGPVWFATKMATDISDAPAVLFLMIQLSRGLEPVEVQSVIDKSIKQNCYAAHPENLLYAMFHDNRPAIRELAVRRILKARKLSSTIIRRFHRPADQLNLNATDYIDMIDWTQIDVTEPPLLASKSEDELWDAIKSVPVKSSYTPQTQAVERMIRVVAEVSLKTVGKEKRNSMIHSILDARKQRPIFESKKDYVV